MSWFGATPHPAEVGVIEAEAVRQRHVARLHAVRDLDVDLGAATPRSDSRTSSTADTDPCRVRGVHAQRVERRGQWSAGVP